MGSNCFVKKPAIFALKASNSRERCVSRQYRNLHSLEVKVISFDDSKERSSTSPMEGRTRESWTFLKHWSILYLVDVEISCPEKPDRFRVALEAAPVVCIVDHGHETPAQVSLEAFPAEHIRAAEQERRGQLQSTKDFQCTRTISNLRHKCSDWEDPTFGPKNNSHGEQ